MVRDGLELPKLCRGACEGVDEGLEPSTPSKKKLSYVWISLYLGRVLLLFSRFRRWGDGDSKKEIWSGRILGAPVQEAMDYVGLGQLKNVKPTVLIIGAFNSAVLATAILVALGTARANCSWNLTVAALMMPLAAGMRLIWMLGMGFAQANTASSMIAEEKDSTQPGCTFTRRQRRVSVSS
jgi:hypothetical protein